MYYKSLFAIVFEGNNTELHLVVDSVGKVLNFFYQTIILQQKIDQNNGKKHEHKRDR